MPGIFTPVELGMIGSACSGLCGRQARQRLSGRSRDMKVFFAAGVLLSALLNIGMGFSTVLAVSVACGRSTAGSRASAHPAVSWR
jgi:OPA family sugar phosphate sensor protein UhpC-like MFS transporter